MMTRTAHLIASFSTDLTSRTRVLSIVASLLLLIASAVGAPSDLDPLFGNLGRVQSAPTGVPDSSSSTMALQADGKIVMVGGTPGDGGWFLVARYNANGSLDTDFGTGGYTTIEFAGIDGRASGVALQADGKIVVVGTVYTQHAPQRIGDIGVARLNSDGSPDMSFDSDSKTIVDFNAFIGASYAELARFVRIAADGKIVVVGQGLLTANHNRFLFAKLNTDGTPDATFGNAGRFADAPNGGSTVDQILDLVLLPDGTMVAAGYFLAVGGNWRFAIKYNAAGTDRAWTYMQGFLGQPNYVHAFWGVAALPNGKFILVGRISNRIAAARLNSDGTIDNTFASPANLPIGDARSVAIQADGKIVANISSATHSSFSLIRWNADGTLDTGFGSNGIASTSIVSVAADFGNKVVIQPDGKILVGGSLQISGSPNQYYFAMVRYRGGNLVPDKEAFDYDGDGRADVSVFRPSNGVWYLDRSTAGFSAVAFGASTDRIVPADYDGDGKTDIAIYRDGEWWILQSSDGVVRAHPFGSAEDKPQPGDFDGDGKDDIAVWRPSNRVWYVLRSGDWGYHSVEFGATGDVPQRGDYDDDGKTDFALFRPSDGNWYIQRSTGGYATIPWGTNGDVPVASDFDGDNKPDVAVFRPSNGVWYILKSGDGQVIDKFFGMAGDVPIPADYDGDGKSDIAVFRPSDGTWYRINSSSGQWAQQAFGFGSDRPTPAAFAP